MVVVLSKVTEEGCLALGYKKGRLLGAIIKLQHSSSSTLTTTTLLMSYSITPTVRWSAEDARDGAQFSVNGRTWLSGTGHKISRVDRRPHNGGDWAWPNDLTNKEVSPSLED